MKFSDKISKIIQNILVLSLDQGSALGSQSQSQNLGLGLGLGSIFQKRYQSRFPVTLGYTKTLPRSVPGYARLHKNLTKVGSRLRSVMQKRNQDRFPVTELGSRIRMVT